MINGKNRLVFKEDILFLEGVLSDWKLASHYSFFGQIIIKR